MKHKRHLFVTAATVAVIGLLAQRETGHAEAPPAAITVTAETAALKDVADTLTFPARVVARVSALVLAQGDGVVQRIPVRLGQTVGRQTNLMLMTHIDPIYTYAAMAVKAPVNGVVSSIDVSEGSQVQKGQRLAAVTDPRQLRVMIEVPAEERLQLKPGFVAQFRYGTNGEVPVRLIGIGPFVDPATGTSQCEFEVGSEAAQAIAAGMVGRISMQTHQHSAIQIPEYAVIYRNEEPFIRILNAGKVKYTAIKLGRKQGDQVEIIDGLNPGQFFVKRASRYLADGELVQVDNNPKTGA